MAKLLSFQTLVQTTSVERLEQTFRQYRRVLRVSIFSRGAFVQRRAEFETFSGFVKQSKHPVQPFQRLFLCVSVFGQRASEDVSTMGVHVDVGTGKDLRFL